MDSATVIIVALIVVVALAATAALTLSKRNDIRGIGQLDSTANRVDVRPPTQRPSAQHERDAHDQRNTPTVAPPPPAPVAVWVEPTDDQLGVTRRQFFNRATVTLMSVGIGSFAAAAFVAFLWPSKTGGFGGAVTVGKLDTIKAGIKQGGGFFYAPEARSWITEYPAEALPLAADIYPETVLATMRQGIVVLSQKCPHLGCRVPECATSQWFECQCHGSQYNRVGEKKAGPAPRGMDHFATTVSAAGDVVINTGSLVPGAAIGVNTTGQEAQGPHCTSGGEH